MKKILLIEDSETTIFFIKKILKNKFEVITTHSFVELINSIHKYQPSLILLDLNLPALSGKQIASIIKKNNISIPIIIYSASPLTEINTIAQEINAAHYLEKGSTPLTIISTIDNVLSKSQ